jgi:hypothetical protein
MIRFDDLIMEVTRRCNMSCPHCMRGEPQSLDMSFDTARNALRTVDGISSLTFTGGEPTLNMKTVRHISDYIRFRHVDLNTFWIVTNGKIASRSLVDVLTDLYIICDEPDMCALAVSNDAWHEEVKIPKMYRALSFFREDGHGPNSQDAVIMEGRAYENGIGRREPPAVSPPEVERFEDGTLYVPERITVSANGNVIPGCDYSFEHIDEECIGNVNEQTWKEILTPYVMEEAA